MDTDRSLSELRVLVVEDDDIAREFMDILLDDYHCPAECVNNGKEAIRKLLSSEYDAVLLDVMMEGIDGYETAQIIRKEISQTLPIIAITALAEEKKCLDAGMNDHLLKPIDIDKLYFMLKKIAKEKKDKE